MYLIWIIFGSFFLAAFFSLILMNQIGANRVLLEHYSIHEEKIQGEIDILHISDLHFYGHMPTRRIDNIIKAIENTLNEKVPDLVVLTGDFIDSNSGIELLEPVLKVLKSKYGIFAVLGNHDYRQYNFLHIFYPLFYKVEGIKTDLIRLKDILKKYDVKIIDHNSTDCNIGKNKVELIGIDPRSYTSPELAQWTKLEADRYRLVLSHYPDAIYHMDGSIDLMLSGHTHGGQITLLGWPLITKSKLPRNKISGISQWSNCKLFVSRGAGVSHYMPFRLFCPAEISRIILKGK